MFESHFGLSGPPFQRNADSAVFLGSRSHSHALAYIRFGVHQAEGFILVAGEVVAGKATRMRTLVANLKQDRVVAAQAVSTQAGDLSRAVVASFGVSAPPRASNAQNLDREAIEVLRMLSNFQLGVHGLRQSFLVGRPKFR